jgi:hypothetical protein
MNVDIQTTWAQQHVNLKPVPFRLGTVQSTYGVLIIKHPVGTWHIASSAKTSKT